MREEKHYPFYIKATVILLALVLLTQVLKTLTEILLPIAFSIVIAILLNPIVAKLQKKKIGLIISIIITMLIAVAFIAGIFYFLSSQITGLAENMPAVKQKSARLLNTFQLWLQHRFGLSIHKQVQLLDEAGNNSKALIGSTLNTALGTLGMVILLPVYVFLFLFYKTLILNFLFKVFAEKNADKVAEILGQTKIAIQSFMVGLLLETSIVAALNTIALLIIGVKYPLLLGVVGAILNIIPYIGGVIAIALPVLLATVYNDGFSTQLWVIAAYTVIQFVDNHFLVPRIVSSKVKLNALVSIVIVLLGGSLWGVGGMFLSIPFTGILKIIFDRVEDLKAWGQLLGDDVPTNYKSFSFARHKRVSVAEEVVKKAEE